MANVDLNKQKTTTRRWRHTFDFSRISTWHWPPTTMPFTDRYSLNRWLCQYINMQIQNQLLRWKSAFISFQLQSPVSSNRRHNAVSWQQDSDPIIHRLKHLPQLLIQYFPLTVFLWSELQRGKELNGARGDVGTTFRVELQLATESSAIDNMEDRTPRPQIHSDSAPLPIQPPFRLSHHPLRPRDPPRSHAQPPASFSNHPLRPLIPPTPLALEA